LQSLPLAFDATKALGLEVLNSLQLLADEAIE
jgi:hypothetical protein